MKSLRLFIIAFTLLLWRLPAEGCTCGSIAPPPPLSQAIQESSIIFVGKPMSTQQIGGYSAVQFQVLLALKGVTTTTINVIRGGFSSCAGTYLPGFSGLADTTTYLLFLSQARTQSSTPTFTITESPCRQHWSRFYWSPFDAMSDSVVKAIQLIVSVNVSVKTYSEPSDVKLMPNPSADQATLSFSLTKATVVNLELYNALGERVLTTPQELKPAGTHREPLDVHTLPAGVYFCRIRTDEGIAVQRVVVAR